jgi:phosphoribosylglycinamide formyltransferase-1
LVRLAILVSGGGSNLQALLDAAAVGKLGAKPRLVIADRPCAALDRAAAAGVKGLLLDRRNLGVRLSSAVGDALKAHEIGLVALAGWLSILDSELVSRWEGRMLNIHPALLPKFGGKGMYGRKVHESVIAAGDFESGCSIHLVTAGVDEGPVLARTKVPVHPNDTPESLAARILMEEHRLYPIAVAERARWIGSHRG